MSISRNVGGMSRYLSRIRTEPIYYKVRNDFQTLVDNIPAIGKSARKALHKVKGSIKYLLLPGVLLKNWDFTITVRWTDTIYRKCTGFPKGKKHERSRSYHVCTKKGRGYTPAEEKPHKYHGISPLTPKPAK